MWLDADTFKKHEKIIAPEFAHPRRFLQRKVRKPFWFYELLNPFHTGKVIYRKSDFTKIASLLQYCIGNIDSIMSCLTISSIHKILLLKIIVL